MQLNALNLWYIAALLALTLAVIALVAAARGRRRPANRSTATELPLSLSAAGELTAQESATISTSPEAQATLEIPSAAAVASLPDGVKDGPATHQNREEIANSVVAKIEEQQQQQPPPPPFAQSEEAPIAEDAAQERKSAIESRARMALVRAHKAAEEEQYQRQSAARGAQRQESEQETKRRQIAEQAEEARSSAERRARQDEQKQEASRKAMEALKAVSELSNKASQADRRAIEAKILRAVAKPTDSQPKQDDQQPNCPVGEEVRKSAEAEVNEAFDALLKDQPFAAVESASPPLIAREEKAVPETGTEKTSLDTDLDNAFSAFEKEPGGQSTNQSLEPIIPLADAADSFASEQRLRRLDRAWGSARKEAPTPQKMQDWLQQLAEEEKLRTAGASPPDRANQPDNQFDEIARKTQARKAAESKWDRTYLATEPSGGVGKLQGKSNPAQKRASSSADAKNAPRQRLEPSQIKSAPAASRSAIIAPVTLESSSNTPDSDKKDSQSVSRQEAAAQARRKAIQALSKLGGS